MSDEWLAFFKPSKSKFLIFAAFLTLYLFLVLLSVYLFYGMLAVTNFWIAFGRGETVDRMQTMNSTDPHVNDEMVNEIKMKNNALILQTDIAIANLKEARQIVLPFDRQIRFEDEVAQYYESSGFRFVSEIPLTARFVATILAMLAYWYLVSCLIYHGILQLRRRLEPTRV